MKERVFKPISILFFLTTLLVMYGTNVGVFGIAKYWSGFELLDMKFTYSTATVQEMITRLGSQGIQHYLYYFIVDVFFIVALANIQIMLSKKVMGDNTIGKRLMITLLLLRATSDLIEDGLLTLVFKKALSTTMVPIISAITSMKFICLFLWGATLCVGAILALRKRKKQII